MSTKLNKRQRIAAELIGLGHRPSAVASELGVSRETISRWRQVAAFNEQSHVYHSIDNDHGRLSARDEESNRAFRWVMDKLDKLAGLKARNDHLTDAEYRRMAEDIVRERKGS